VSPSGKDATNDKSECVVKFSISRHQFSSYVYNNFPHFPVEALVWRAVTATGAEQSTDKTWTQNANSNKKRRCRREAGEK